MTKRWRFLACLCLPLYVSAVRLAELGFFSGTPVFGAMGSDFYAGVITGRLLDRYGLFHLPLVVPDFNYPDGMPLAKLAEYFSETLALAAHALLIKVVHDPARALVIGFGLSTLANIWGTWVLFWRRFADRSALAAIAGWAVIALSPWPWQRTTVHWQLSWVPVFLWCVFLWWDLLVEARPVRPWKTCAAHLLLLSQSIYYGFFMVLLVPLLALGGRAWQLPAAARRRFGVAVLAAAIGYGCAAGITVARIGGPSAFGAAVAAKHPDAFELHQFSIRMRLMTTGGPESLWNRFAEAAWGQKPGKFGRDEEGFVAPLPKLAFLFLLVLTGLSAFREPRRREEWLRSFLPAMAVIWGFFLIGLQESPWIRVHLIYPLVPFIRSYARIFMPVLCVSGVWFASALAGWRPELKRGPAAGPAAAVFCLSLLLVDYGWPQELRHVVHAPPCDAPLRLVRDEGKPLLIQRVLEDPAHQSLCYGIKYEVSAMTSVPLLTEPFEVVAQRLIPGTPYCAQMRDQVHRALAAAGGNLLWWYEGSAKYRRESLDCLGVSEGKILLGPTASGPGEAAILVLIQAKR